ncbi:hypothetical protein [Vibrio gallaecicus]|uniref:hypothetical protein n=1 Tax=Vibrio gallaecicus TaxID=552386 RepID=UPI0025B5DA49|nr:hypothetical protein [Vibrio gallaecicus]MDN3613263.1 hypothetical protein [Vibrio gallaecicus]
MFSKIVNKDSGSIFRQFKQQKAAIKAAFLTHQYFYKVHHPTLITSIDKVTLFIPKFSCSAYLQLKRPF